MATGIGNAKVEGAEIPEEPLEDASMHCVTADLPGEVSPSSDEDRIAWKDVKRMEVEHMEIHIEGFLCHVVVSWGWEG